MTSLLTLLIVSATMGLAIASIRHRGPSMSASAMALTVLEICALSFAVRTVILIASRSQDAIVAAVIAALFTVAAFVVTRSQR